LNNARGVSIIAAIFIIVVLAFMGVMFLSLINTGSFTAVNDMQSAQALSVAEGGVEFAKLYLRPYDNWYGFSADPLAVATNMTLGSGSFTTTITFPATTIRKSFGGGTTTIRVYSVDRFTAPGTISIADELWTYAGVATDAPLGPRLTGVLCVPPSLCSGQNIGTIVYPMLTLSANITDTDTTIPFAGNYSKFILPGTISIGDPVNGDEEISCSSVQTAPTLAFTGCARDVGTAAVHSAGLIILPIQSTQQALITSTGDVGAARRVIVNAANQ